MTPASISERESREIEAANSAGSTAVVFIHGLWLLPSSWAAWADVFKQAGYAPGPREEDLEAGRRPHHCDHQCPRQEARDRIRRTCDRGPLLIIDGERDHTVPWAIANAAYKRQRRNPAVTEIVKMPNRGHALTIDHGWHEVAQKALDFVKRFA